MASQPSPQRSWCTESGDQPMISGLFRKLGTPIEVRTGIRTPKETPSWQPRRRREPAGLSTSGRAQQDDGVTQPHKRRVCPPNPREVEEKENGTQGASTAQPG